MQRPTLFPFLYCRITHITSRLTHRLEYKIQSSRSSKKKNTNLTKLEKGPDVGKTGIIFYDIFCWIVIVVLSYILIRD